MPRQCLMSWEPKTRRWQKMYRRHRLSVSCRQLGCPETMLGSYQAANAWFLARKAEIDGTPKPLSQEEILHRWPELAPIDVLSHTRQQVEAAPSSPMRQILLDDLDAIERSANPEPAPIPQNRSIKFHVEAWLAGQKAKAEAGEISPGEYGNRKYHVAHVESWLGDNAVIDDINEARWEQFYRYLLGEVSRKKWSKSYAGKVYRTGRLFIEHLAGLNLISEPRNLRDRGHRFTVPLKQVRILTPEQLGHILAKVKGQLRLHVLLGMNCGMTQQDISDLHPSEVDWQRGTITRRRSKTDHHEDVPIVTYELWPETIDLLKTYRSDHPEHVLVTTAGTPWLNKEFKNTDNIRSAWRRAKLPGSFKLLRATCASLLESHPVYGGRVATLYLGHSPQSIKDRHYARPAESLLGEALAWLRTQLGFPL